METPTYQLTRHPSGSLKEIWAVSYPLIIGLFSFSLMFFIDRLLLSFYSLPALNAATTAGTALFLLLATPTSIVAITEVFVGRYHGGNQFYQISRPVWQMIWFILLLTPFLWLLGWLLAPLLFFETGNEKLEQDFFFIGLFFAPIFCIEIALGGFFIGIGKMKIVTIGTLLANVINIGLDILLIFGWKDIPGYGVKGAALATGLAQTCQIIFYCYFFFSREYRQTYQTFTECKLDKNSFCESLSIGIPAGFGRLMETLAHFVFFRMMIRAGGDNLTIASIVQSIYVFLSCSTEGISQAVKTIISNLIGGNQSNLIGKVLRSALTLHSTFFLVIVTTLILCSKQLLSIFIVNDYDAYSNPALLNTLKWCCFCMSLFYLFDGFSWIFIGHLTAVEDTKFVFYTSILTNWLMYVLPVALIIIFFRGEAVQAWTVMIFYSLSNFTIYFLRYQFGQWQQIRCENLSIEKEVKAV